MAESQVLHSIHGAIDLVGRKVLARRATHMFGSCIGAFGPFMVIPESFASRSTFENHIEVRLSRYSDVRIAVFPDARTMPLLSPGLNVGVFCRHMPNETQAADHLRGMERLFIEDLGRLISRARNSCSHHV